MKRNIWKLPSSLHLARLLFLLFIAIMISGCNRYYELVLEDKNPTSFYFDAHVQQVKSAIKECFGKYKVPGLVLYFKGDLKAESTIKNILDDKNNLHDSYLWGIDPVKSKIYFKDDKPLLYSADFHLHLDSIGENKTQVTVITLKSEVSTGVRPGVGDNLTIGAANYKSVPASTIEEYEILLTIGKQLGQEGMPACNYPSMDANRVKRYNSFF